MADLRATADGSRRYYDYDKLDRVIRESARRGRRRDGAVQTRCTRTTATTSAGDLRRPRCRRRPTSATVDCASLATLPRATRLDYDARAPPDRADRPARATGSRPTYTANGERRDDDQPAARRRRPTSTTSAASASKVDRSRSTPRARSRRRFEYDAAGNLKREISPRAWTRRATRSRSTYVRHDLRLRRRSTSSRASSCRRRAPTRHSSTRTAAYDANGNLTVSALPHTSATIDGVPAARKTVMTYLDPGWISTSAGQDQAQAPLRLHGRGLAAPAHAREGGRHAQPRQAARVDLLRRRHAPTGAGRHRRRELGGQHVRVRRVEQPRQGAQHRPASTT